MSKTFYNKVLVTHHELVDRVDELATQIERDYHETQKLTIIPILTGSFIFAADLIRRLPHRLEIEWLTVSSYPGKAMKSVGPKIIGPIPDQVANQHILVIDDILDSGQTLQHVKAHLAKENPASIKTCVLLHKQLPKAAACEADYVGFQIPDEFVVGYGLDYNGEFRNHPEIVVLDEAWH